MNDETGQNPDIKQAGDPRNDTASWTLLPPPPGVCSQCGIDHEPEEPHNRDRLLYQFSFYAEHGRWPTWKDAMAHCTPEVQEMWSEGLRRLGVEVDG